MYIAMDMGTSNTRVWLCDGERVICAKRGSFGAKLGASEGRARLFDKVKSLIFEILSQNKFVESDMEYIISSGMSGSEIGLCEIPHVSLPADVYSSAKAVLKRDIPEICSVPFLFVPGLKRISGDLLSDIMRGEETEVFGILSRLPNASPAVILLPGTHNKIIRINADGNITDFLSTASGELLDIIISKSILRGSVSHSFILSEIDAKRGMEYAEANGINAAMFHVRVMEKNGVPHDKLSSFIYGAVLGEDVKLIRKYANGSAAFVGGNEQLQAVYCTLLDSEEVVPLQKDVASSATLFGLQQIYKIYKALQTREKVKEAIENNKIISIIRNPDRESLLRAVSALCDGGICLAEITFDRSGQKTREEICSMISELSREFEGRMFIGAGTVTDLEEVKLAFNAGASFIVSPNCDAKVVSLTKKLGLVSIPAAYTATEIAAALNSGADYIKLFPADQATRNYVKAITAPLSDAKLFAVGGVTAENARIFINNGFFGIGVGSNLYNKQLIEAEDYASLTKLSRTYVQAVKG